MCSEWRGAAAVWPRALLPHVSTLLLLALCIFFLWRCRQRDCTLTVCTVIVFPRDVFLLFMVVAVRVPAEGGPWQPPHLQNMEPQVVLQPAAIRCPLGVASFPGRNQQGHAMEEEASRLMCCAGFAVQCLLSSSGWHSWNLRRGVCLFHAGRS